MLSPKRERELFENRHEFDLVVYHNLDSSHVAESTSNTVNISHSSSTYNSNDAMQHLCKAIFDTEFKKRLKRSPVLLNGGFNAWFRLTDEAGVERGTSQNSETQSNAQNILRSEQGNNNFKRNGVIITDENRSWTNSLYDRYLHLILQT